MPDYSLLSGGGTDMVDAPSATGAPVGDISDSMQQQAAAAAAPQSQSWFTTAAGDAALAIPDLADTVASSIPFLSKGLGIERGDVNNKMLQAIGLPGLTNFYADNKGGVSLASGLLGTVAAEFATRGLASEALPFVGALRAIPGARRVMALDTEYQNALKVVGQIDQTIAERGLLGASQYIESAKVTANLLGGEAGDAAVTIGRAAAADKARRTGFLASAARFGATEAVMATTLNQNDFLYSEDMSSNIFNAALGLGIGGVIGAVGANYAMRKFVNGSMMQKAYAGALDSTGLEEGRLNQSYMNAVDKLGGKSNNPLDGFYGHYADKATDLLVSARSAPMFGVDSSTARKLAGAQEEAAIDEVQKFTLKGLPGASGTSFSVDSPGFGNAIRDLVHNDAGALVGAERAGGIGDGMSINATHEEIFKKLDQQIAKNEDILNDPAKLSRLSEDEIMAIRQNQKSSLYFKKLTPMAVVDGEFTSMDHAASFDGWVEPVVKPENNDGLQLWQTYDPGGAGHGVGIDADMSLYFKGFDTNINNADHFDVLRMYRAGEQLANTYAANPTRQLIVPKDNPNWFQLDLAERVLQKNPNANVAFPPGMNRTTAQIESFAQKAEQLAGTSANADFAKLRVRLNLPKLTAYEAGLLGTTETPQELLLRATSANGKSSTAAAIRASSLDDLKQGIVDSKKLTNIAEMSRTSLDKTQLTGNSFGFLTDFKGDATKPLLVYKRPFQVADWTKDNLSERLATRKIGVLTGLVGTQADDFTKGLASMIASDPNTQMASRASSLADVQMQAATPGFGNMSPTSAIRGLTDTVSTQEWKFRDNPIIQAVIRVRESAERMAQKFMKETFEGTMQDSLSRLNGPANEQSRLLLDNFHSHAGGWDLMPHDAQSGAGFVRQATADGKENYRFLLDQTAENKERFKAQYGRDMPDGQVLLDPRGAPVELDDLGYDIQNRFNQISAVDRRQKNVLNQALGLPEIRSTNWYVPSPDTENKFMGFTYDPLNKKVQGGTIIANTQQDFDKQLSRMRSDPDSPMNRDGHSFITTDEIKARAGLLGQAEMEMQNPGRTYIAGGKTNQGFLSQRYTTVGRFQESMFKMRDSFLQHGRDVTEVLMRDQIQAAKLRANIAANRVGADGGKSALNPKSRSIFDYYVEAATGAKPQNVGKKWFETRADALLGDSKQRINESWAQAKQMFAEANPFTFGKTEQAAWEKMRDNLADAMPFQSAAEYAEAKGLGNRPASMKALTAGLNRFESTWMLRVMEPLQAIMNVSGVFNAAPAVIRHLQIRAGETAEDWAAKHGHIADIFSTPGKAGVATLNPAKVMWGGFKKSMSNKFDADLDYAVRQGTLSQAMPEFQRAFNAAETRSGLDIFMNGTPYPTATSKIGQAFQKKGLVGWTSLLTDKSEDFSRMLSHTMGLNLADSMGIEGLAARHSFAHDIANKMIANYSPQNKPEIFQGAIGAPIGLFQSFIQAYYQRMFRYIETGDARAVATQYAMQGGLYGLKTVPGFTEMNSLFGQFDDGKSSPYDSMVARLGPQAGSMLMGGALGNIPTLFGAEGADLTARGDTTYRTPVLNAPAIWSTGKKLFDAVSQAHEAFGANSPELSSQQVAEIFSNAIPNRSIAGMVEQLAAGGSDTDNAGQLVAQTHNLMQAAYRMIGTRSLSQSQEIEAFYANKQAMEMKAAQDGILQRNTRARFRDGLPLDTTQEGGVFDQYVANGGDPKSYKSWLKNSYKTATTTRSQRQLDAAMKNPQNHYQVDRLTAAHAAINSEEAEPEVDDSTYGPPPDEAPL